jgi:hypothetical protein
MFRPAVKHEAKLRMCIAGPSGSGKTWTALSIARHMNGKVALLDTEHGSASKYADLWEFDVLEMAPPYHPQRFVKAIEAAAEAGYSVLILDSLSHAWAGTGGLLEIVDEIAARMKTTNSYAAWKDATPIHNALIEAILAAPLHVIATMRSKQDYSMDKDASGKTIVRKVGMQPIQRDGFEYEFDVFAEMDIDNRLIVTKTRCPALAGLVVSKPKGDELTATLLEWLSGEALPPRPTTEPTGAHWIDDDRERGLFWAKVGEYGLDEKSLKQLTGIEHIHDYPGTANELLQLAKQKLAEAQPQEA